MVDRGEWSKVVCLSITTTLRSVDSILSTLSVNCCVSKLPHRFTCTSVTLILACPELSFMSDECNWCSSVTEYCGDAAYDCSIATGACSDVGGGKGWPSDCAANSAA